MDSSCCFFLYFSLITGIHTNPQMHVNSPDANVTGPVILVIALIQLLRSKTSVYLKWRMVKISPIRMITPPIPTRHTAFLIYRCSSFSNAIFAAMTSALTTTFIKLNDDLGFSTRCLKTGPSNLLMFLCVFLLTLFGVLPFTIRQKTEAVVQFKTRPLFFKNSIQSWHKKLNAQNVKPINVSIKISIKCQIMANCGVLSI